MADGEATAQTTKQKNKGAWKRKSFTRRQHEARAWLERLVPPERITDARVNQLADFVDRYRPGSKFQIIADAMVKNNEVPTMKNVAARYESRKNAYLRRNAPTSPIDLTPALVEHLTTQIRASWERRGHGPTWAEIRDGMGWDRAQTKHALTQLRTAGLIAFTNDSGSLTLAGKAAHHDATATKSA
ncbi:hypothetical protein ACW4FP_19125 (plasmid) [Paenarthrobacter ureafaciens]